MLPTIVQHLTSTLGLGESKSSPAWEAVPHLQLSSLPEQLVAAQGCPQQLCWLQATTLAGQEATAQPSPAEGKMQPREGRVMVCWGGRKGRAKSSCLTKAVSHRKSRARSKWICSASAKGRPRDLSVSPGALLRQWSGYSGLCWSRAKPNSTQLFDHRRKSNYGEEFFLVDLSDFLWRVMVLWALCFFTHLFKKPHFGTSQFFQPRKTGFCSWLAQKWLLKSKMKHSCQELDAQHPMCSWGQRNRSQARREILRMAAHYVSAERAHPTLHSESKHSSQVICPATGELNKLPAQLEDRINSSMVSAEQSQIAHLSVLQSCSG